MRIDNESFCKKSILITFAGVCVAIMQDFKVTNQQKAFFDTFGYLVFRGLMQDRIMEITEEFDAVFTKHGGNFNGKPHTFKKTSTIVAFLGHSEKLASLLDDPRIHAICSTLLGDDYNYLTSAGNKYVGDTGWHSDTSMDKRWPGNLKSLNVSFYLDPVTKETGALRVIPGSHYIGDQFTEILKEQIHATDMQKQWGIDRADLPAVPLDIRPGDLLVFNNYMKHAAFGGGNNRRVLLINFSRHYTEEHMAELHEYVSTFAPYWVEELHGEAVLHNASSERLRHLRQIQENQAHLPELARQAKAAATQS
ncbi:phytanoyl-CoA dioxygenase family protein [Paenibacillus sp. BC26]|uniref:phytanoyl-CoA dioxygenase family protein n=1 Tax=Paenibacillus sp. BC26 TaxID=1881032 RepID=UPI0008E7EF15|nr:phytanoyl-CoA dioxygenase family protein [Paenibacillus sp. BC26]SFS60510.1 Ectoine hydroxylase-related dioxygenase, phytanoyl-CoA dioxygenase (PhyH) family [Paenibacillus sp. BC26]